jgi:hypothetical protein
MLSGAAKLFNRPQKGLAAHFGEMVKGIRVGEAILVSPDAGRMSAAGEHK